ncbi:MAG: hypothetical protein HFH79_05780 [Lachnospiraceae bacterium]|nr:hypothetical protein [Lachnospiraceae bacterium]
MLQQTALTQIKERAYPESLQEYVGSILLAGITYDRKTKEHHPVCFDACVVKLTEEYIEYLWKKTVL